MKHRKILICFAILLVMFFIPNKSLSSINKHYLPLIDESLFNDSTIIDFSISKSENNQECSIYNRSDAIRTFLGSGIKVLNEQISKDTNKLFLIAFHGFEKEKEIDSLIYLIEHKDKIIGIEFVYCDIDSLPNSTNLLNCYLYSFLECDSIKSIRNLDCKSKRIISIIIDNCLLHALPAGIEDIPSLLELEITLNNKDYYVEHGCDFDINRELKKFSRKRNIISLRLDYFNSNKFPDAIFDQTALQYLEIKERDTFDLVPDRFDELPNLRAFSHYIKDERKFPLGLQYLFKNKIIYGFRYPY